MPNRRRRGRITRDLVLFVFGLGGIAHETIRVQVDRPYLLLLFGWMTGLPIVSPLLEVFKTKVANGRETTESEA